eukprot:SAG31_NODE_10326_length_1153_cov_1.853890_2_plen_87_part_00
MLVCHSQVFGELLGLWCVAAWQQAGKPESVRLCELGPGQGTMLRDILRTAAQFPAFHAALLNTGHGSAAGLALVEGKGLLSRCCAH